MKCTDSLPTSNVGATGFSTGREALEENQEVTLRQAKLLNEFGNWRFSTATGMVSLSPGAGSITGEAMASTFCVTELLKTISRLERSEFFRSYRRLVTKQSSSEVLEFALPRNGSEKLHLRIVLELHSEAGERPREVVGLVQSTSKVHSLTEQLEQLSHYDSVTSLPNRKRFDEIFAERLEERAFTGAGLAFLIVDLTRFREVNFALTHVVGDELLRMVGQRIRAVLHERDEVARVGTRFPVLLQDADTERAAQCAHAICAALEVPFQLGGISYEIGAHIGISHCPSDDTTYSGLLRKADIAVEQAAHRGQSVATYDAKIDKHTPYRLGLIGDFRHAAKNGEIRLYCQPKIEMRTRTVIGAEVLARWVHPTKGLIPPDEFVELIEGTELIHVLTNHMLAGAAQCALGWQPIGIAVPLAVNLSTQDVATPALAEYLAGLLKTTKIDPSLLELEVTERSLMRNPTGSIAELNRLRDMGFRLSIDDFGTGYSSLNYLTQLPVDVIKIDHSFTMKMVHDKRSATIVRSTIHMAHDLGMTVVAEGTADVDIWNALEALDCDEAQGYYIARPMPIEDFSNWLQSVSKSYQYASSSQQLANHVR